jgi:hypothetical protein
VRSDEFFGPIKMESLDHLNTHTLSLKLIEMNFPFWGRRGGSEDKINFVSDTLT